MFLVKTSVAPTTSLDYGPVITYGEVGESTNGRLGASQVLPLQKGGTKKLKQC